VCLVLKILKRKNSKTLKEHDLRHGNPSLTSKKHGLMQESWAHAPIIDMRLASHARCGTPRLELDMHLSILWAQAATSKAQHVWVQATHLDLVFISSGLGHLTRYQHSLENFLRTPQCFSVFYINHIYIYIYIYIYYFEKYITQYLRVKLHFNSWFSKKKKNS
jgi:hypothetical protein